MTALLTRPRGGVTVIGVRTTTTNYVYDGASVIEEVDQNANLLARYSQGAGIDEPLSELRSGAISFYEQDGLGSVTSLTSTGGALANTYVYDSFGNLTSSSGTVTNPYQYTGRDYDSETGLRYYRARYYDASVGRFVSEDPIRFDAGIDYYRYAENGPTNYADPSGLCPPVDPCKGKAALPFDYSRIGRDGQTIRRHIESQHMVLLSNGAGGQFTDPATGKVNSQYRFSPQGTGDENFAAVVQLNAMTFAAGNGTVQGGTIVYEHTFTPAELATVSRPIGIINFAFGDAPPPIRRPFQSMMWPTATNRLVLNLSCQPITSYPIQPGGWSQP